MSLNVGRAASLVLLGGLLFGASRLNATTVKWELGPPEPLSQGLYGFNADMVAATAFQGITFGGPEMEDAVRELRPRALRFPGGTTANNYLWKQDSFSEQPGDLTGWAGEQLKLFRQMGRPYDLPGYVRLCRQFRLKPVWVLNVYEETPESVVALLDYLDSLGLTLRFMELGNEPYWDPRSLNDARRYIELCKPLVAAIRERSPDLKLGACFAPLISEPFDYMKKWNAVLARETWYDAVVFHDYYGGQGIELEPGGKLPVRALLHPDESIEHSIDTLKQMAPGKPVWFTEWNLGMEGIKQWKNHGAELLFIGAVFSRIMEHRDTVALSMFHQIYEDGFGTFHLEKESGQIKTSASYELFRLLGAMFEDAERVRSLTFNNEDLTGFATEGEDGVRLFVVNRGSADVSFSLPAESPAQPRQFTLVCPPERLLGKASEFIRSDAVRGGTAMLPACSVNLVAHDAAIPAGKPVRVGPDPFPARPHLTLWYPPYASQQPRVNPEGTYVLDLSKLTDKPMVVVKMALPQVVVGPDVSLSLRFEARAEGGGPLIVNLPEQAPGKSAQEARSEWFDLTEKFRGLRLVFRHDPKVNNGEVGFFFNEETVKRGGRYEFRDFRITMD